MPRRSVGSKSANGTTSADISELQAALAATLPKVAITAFPGDVWQELVFACMSCNLSVIISPQMDGRALRVSIPVGNKRLAVVAGNDQELLESLRALLLAVRKIQSTQA